MSEGVIVAQVQIRRPMRMDSGVVSLVSAFLGGIGLEGFRAWLKRRSSERRREVSQQDAVTTATIRIIESEDALRTALSNQIARLETTIERLGSRLDALGTERNALWEENVRLRAARGDQP